MSHPISTKDRTFIGQQNDSSGTAEVDPLVNTAELWRMSQMTPPFLGRKCASVASRAAAWLFPQVPDKASCCRNPSRS
jgi:hypothetical protein